MRAWVETGLALLLGQLALALLLLLLVSCGGDEPQPWLELEGSQPGTTVVAWWAETPLDVYTVDGADVGGSVGFWNTTAGRRVLNPALPAERVTLDAFASADLRGRLFRAVLVRTDGDRAEHGETDLRYDRRTGQLINAVVSVHPRPERPEVVHHEFGHALGLAHGPPGTLMAPQLPAGPAPLADYQAAAVRGLGR